MLTLQFLVVFSYFFKRVENNIGCCRVLNGGRITIPKLVIDKMSIKMESFLIS